METNHNQVRIFDTTLRDGEQCPGAAMTEDQKLDVAGRLAALGVDIIEAGFPISSPVQFRAVERVAQEIEGPVICGLARAVRPDIEAAARALRPAPRARIHTFIASSAIHMKHKLGKTPPEVVRMAVEAVTIARDLCGDVEFSPEDATRSEWDFLVELVSRAIEAGATTINVPDTVGYTTPEEYGALFAHLIKHTPSNGVTFSAHCHNDLGMATANSLAAVRSGARQIECTINGIGERAGNTALEEVVMAMRTRAEFYQLHTNIKSEQITAASLLVRTVTGMQVQPNKAIVGDNAFAHESGIHQDGVLKNPLTYEIMTPESVGLSANRMVLGRHSGRHGFKDRMTRLGHTLDPEELEVLYDAFVRLADKKKEVYDEDLLALLDESNRRQERTHFSLEAFHVSTGLKSIPTATVAVRREDGTLLREAACGDGPIDTLHTALERTTGIVGRLRRFRLQPISEGRDAQAVAAVILEAGGRNVSGRGTSTDILEAAALALMDAFNRAAEVAPARSADEKLQEHGI